MDPEDICATFSNTQVTPKDARAAFSNAHVAPNHACAVFSNAQLAPKHLRATFYFIFQLSGTRARNDQRVQSPQNEPNEM